jgi:hypothetical protein
VNVTLTWSEAELAAYAGIKRHLLGISVGRPDRYGYAQENPWQTIIEACGAEMAVAKATGYYWTAWQRTPAEVEADVGDDVQVKHRDKTPRSLLLHPDYDDRHRFVLVAGSLPNYRLLGWCSGEFGKQDEFWRTDTGRPAFFVPEGRLEPMATFDCPRADREPAL